MTDRIERIMSLAPHEFAGSIRAMDAGALCPDGTAALFPLGRGRARVTYEPLPPMRIGGLLELPQSRVTLIFDNLEPAERQRFVTAFDQAFQRGGG